MKILYKILSLAIIMLLCSCLKETEYEYSSDTAILSFSIGNFKVIYKDVDYLGKDTIVNRTEGGNNHYFTIDQKQKLIFNQDSLPYGSVVEKLTTSIACNGIVYYRKKYSDNTYIDTLWSISDSIDFREPVTFFVKSTDNKYIREYNAYVNVHLQDPDSMRWRRVVLENFPPLIEQKAAIIKDSIIIIGKDTSGAIGVISCNVNNGKNWSAFSPLSGIEVSAIIPSLSILNDTLYMIESGKLLWSTSGSTWINANIIDSIIQIIPFRNSQYSDSSLWAINGSGKILRISGPGVWEEVGSLPPNFPQIFLNGICYPLKSNPNITRNVVIGVDTLLTLPYSTVWTKLSTETAWTKVSSSSKNDSLKCPRLNNLSLIYYDNNLFSFGAESQSGFGKLPSFYGFFQSSDNGITWRDCEHIFYDYNTWNRFMEFPAQLRDLDSNFSFVVDSYNQIWIIPGSGKEIWIGAINRLLI